MGQTYSQAFPPAATFTEKTLADQTGKIFLVTGATSGLGKELTRILYSKNAKVYVAARLSEKATQTIDEIKSNFPKSTGVLVYLHLDLSDLTGIKTSASEFLAKEQKLDVLWNNAGVMIPPKGSKTKQGYELQLGTNALAPFLFTQLLTPALVEAAKTAPAGSVRVIWVSSSIVAVMAPKGGVDMDNLDYRMERNVMHKYAVSKAANSLYSHEYCRRYSKDGIISVSIDPGNLKTDLQRHASALIRKICSTLSNAPINGAYTELFAGLSPEISLSQNGAWIVPYGRFGTLRKDLADAGKSESEGGSGTAARFWDWSEKEVKPYS